MTTLITAAKGNKMFRNLSRIRRRLWLVFSTSRHSKLIKLIMKTVEQIKSGIWEMKGGKYTKSLAEIQARRIFRLRDI